MSGRLKIMVCLPTIVIAASFLVIVYEQRRLEDVTGVDALPNALKDPLSQQPPQADSAGFLALPKKGGQGARPLGEAEAEAAAGEAGPVSGDVTSGESSFPQAGMHRSGDSSAAGNTAGTTATSGGNSGVENGGAAVSANGDGDGGDLGSAGAPGSAGGLTEPRAATQNAVDGWPLEAAAGAAQAEANAASLAAPPVGDARPAAVHSEPSQIGTFPKRWLEKFSQADLDASAAEGEKWRKMTVDAFHHAWDSYKRKAMGAGEIRPVSGKADMSWGNIGMQLVDALSTMAVMGLEDELTVSEKWISDHLDFETSSYQSFFEMTIRGLGGLASAHALTGRSLYLEKAHELAKRLGKALDNDLHFPAQEVNIATGQVKLRPAHLIAEIGTNQLEFRYVAQNTGDTRMQELTDRAINQLMDAAPNKGLWSVEVAARRRGEGNISVHDTSTLVSFGAMGDSYYEYLLKMYLQTGKRESRYKDKFKLAMNEMFDKMVHKTKGGLTYIADIKNGKLLHKMDHLACFMGGMLTYAARELPAQDVDSRWEETGAAITETCSEMYSRTASGLAPEFVVFNLNEEKPRDMKTADARMYKLRPEAAEAIFYNFYYTGDPKYRRMAGAMIEAIEKHCRAMYGYSGVNNVEVKRPTQSNSMETFFLAETLKYLYLTFVPNPESVVSLSEYVFNTEAHPLRIYRGDLPEVGSR